MSTEFDRKAKVLTGCYGWIKDDGDGKEFLLAHCLGISAAVLYTWGDIKDLSKELRGYAEDAYSQMLTGLGLEEGNYQDYADVVMAWQDKEGN